MHLMLAAQIYFHIGRSECKPVMNVSVSQLLVR